MIGDLSSCGAWCAVMDDVGSRYFLSRYVQHANVHTDCLAERWIGSNDMLECSMSATLTERGIIKSKVLNRRPMGPFE